MQVEAIIEDIANRIKQVPGIIAIVLGGSRARGTHTSKSDMTLVSITTMQKISIFTLSRK